MKSELEKFLSVLVIIVILKQESHAEKSTIERIRKHQEWLHQRRQQKQKSQFSQSPLKTSFELPNLWRFPKVINNSKELENSSFNEVFPENEKPRAASKFNISNNLFKKTEGISRESASYNVSSTDYSETSTSPISMTTSLEITETTTVSSATKTDETSGSSTLLMSTTSLTTTKQPKAKLRPYPRWGNWSDWSECSRSCGVGVMYQQRKCLNRNATTGKRYISNSCVGVYKRFRTCNEEVCPITAEKNFRAVQCSAFNDVDFQGQKYVWEPYIKDDAECELNCKPLGMKYFATLNASVVDGTPCLRPAEFYRSGFHDRAVCVNGVCKPMTPANLE